MKFVNLFIILSLVIASLLLFGCINPSICGDGVCQADETQESCPQDCGTINFCGDKYCDINLGENETNCPQDCGETNPICGNDICEIEETSESCPQDCESDLNGGHLCNDEYYGTLCDGELINGVCYGDCYSECSAVDLTKGFAKGTEVGNGLNNFASIFQGDNVSSEQRIFVDEGKPVLSQGSYDSNLLKANAIKLSFSKDTYLVELKSQTITEKLNSTSEQIKSTSKQAIINSQKAIIQNQKESTLAFIKTIAPVAAKTADYYWSFSGFAVKNLTPSDVERIRNQPNVKSVHKSKLYHTTMIDVIPLLDINTVWTTPSPVEGYLDGTGVKIGVIDTGIDYTHSDFGSCTTQQFLANQCEKVVGGYDFANNDSDPMDDMGHGTHVAGTIAANGTAGGQSFKGVAPNAKLYALKVFGANGGASEQDILSAIEWAIDPNQDGNNEDHLDVINLSLGGVGDPDDKMSLAIDRAADNGVVSVISAGNEGAFFSVGSPGTARKAITVGATYKKDYLGSYWDQTNPVVDQVTGFSSKGPVIFGEGLSLLKPDIVAPGALICATRWGTFTPGGKYVPCIDDEHILLAGTSMSAPVVAGTVALLKQANPNWTSEMIKSALILTGKEALLDGIYEVPSVMPNPNELEFGGGRINPLKALTPRILTNPASISFQNSLDANFLIKNIYSNSLKVVINSGDIVPVLFEGQSINEFCLQPNEQKQVFLTLRDITRQEIGIFTDKILIETGVGCELNSQKENYTIPFIYSKTNTLKLNLKLKNKDYPTQNFGFLEIIYSPGPSNSDGITIIPGGESMYFFNEWDANDSIEIIKPVFDYNKIDVIVFLQALQDLPTGSKNITNTFVVKGVDLNGADYKEIEIDLTKDAFEVLDTSATILDSLEVQPYFIVNSEGPFYTSPFDTSACGDAIIEYAQKHKIFYGEHQSNFYEEPPIKKFIYAKPKGKAFKFLNEAILLKFDFDKASSSFKIAPIKDQNLMVNLHNSFIGAEKHFLIIYNDSTTGLSGEISTPRIINVRSNQETISEISLIDWSGIRFPRQVYMAYEAFYRNLALNSNVLNINKLPFEIKLDQLENNIIRVYVQSTTNPSLINGFSPNPTITLTRPNGSLVNSNNLFLGINCGIGESTFEDYWVSGECQIGRYFIDVNMVGTLNGPQLTKSFSADWNGTHFLNIN